LAQHMPPGVSWTKPSGGLFVWVRLPEHLDGRELLDCALNAEGVAFVPGAGFFFEDRGRNTLRLSYSLASEAQIEEGIARLPRLLAAEAPPAEGQGPRWAAAGGEGGGG